MNLGEISVKEWNIKKEEHRKEWDTFLESNKGEKHCRHNYTQIYVPEHPPIHIYAKVMYPKHSKSEYYDYIHYETHKIMMCVMCGKVKKKWSLRYGVYG